MRIKDERVEPKPTTFIRFMSRNKVHNSYNKKSSHTQNILVHNRQLKNLKNTLIYIKSNNSDILFRQDNRVF